MVSLPSPREIYHEKPVRALFESIDTSGDGVVTFREMILGIHDKGLDWASCGLDPEKVNMRLADADGDQSVNFEEFWRYVMKSGKGQREDPAENAKEYLESVCMATCVALAPLHLSSPSLSLSLCACAGDERQWSWLIRIIVTRQKEMECTIDTDIRLLPLQSNTRLPMMFASRPSLYVFFPAPVSYTHTHTAAQSSINSGTHPVGTAHGEARGSEAIYVCKA